MAHSAMYFVQTQSHICRAARNQDGRENQFTLTLSSAFKMR